MKSIISITSPPFSSLCIASLLFSHEPSRFQSCMLDIKNFWLTFRDFLFLWNVWILLARTLILAWSFWIVLVSLVGFSSGVSTNYLWHSTRSELKPLHGLQGGGYLWEHLSSEDLSRSFASFMKLSCMNFQVSIKKQTKREHLCSCADLLSWLLSLFCLFLTQLSALSLLGSTIPAAQHP